MGKIVHPPKLFIFTEEPSADAFVSEFIPRLLGEHLDVQPIRFQGKQGRLKNLESRLKGLRKSLQPNQRIIILVDGDREDCQAVKTRLEELALRVGLKSKTLASSKHGFEVVTRIAVQELEAWYLGDPVALRELYPQLPGNFETKATYRYPDKVNNTWETLQRLLRRHGHLEKDQPLPKIELGKRMGRTIDPNRSSSPSFLRFCEALRLAAESISTS